MAYRSATHDTTHCSPVKMMLGRELKMPIDLLFGKPENEPPQTATNYASTMQERLERVHEFARGHMQLMLNRMKQRYDPLLEHQPLEAGEAVWLHNPQRKKGLTPKLQCPWQGPYIITKRINDLVYRIQLGPKAKPKVVHRNRLWHYSGINAPTWYHAHEQESTSPAGMTTATTPEREQNTSPAETLTTSNELPIEPLRRSDRSRRAPVRYGT